MEGGVRISKQEVIQNIEEIHMLIYSEVNSKLHLSASVMVCSFLVSTAVVINLPM
jgi:hypothetical protein